jgi:hypothetical protein
MTKYCKQNNTAVHSCVIAYKAPTLFFHLKMDMAERKEDPWQRRLLFSSSINFLTEKSFANSDRYFLLYYCLYFFLFLSFLLCSGFNVRNQKLLVSLVYKGFYPFYVPPESRARICKHIRSPGIDSDESIPPAHVAWRGGTTNMIVGPARQAGNRFLGSLEGLQMSCNLSLPFMSCLRSFVAPMFFCSHIFPVIYAVPPSFSNLSHSVTLI